MTFIHAPLLQPLRIGAMTIQNRFCAGPLTLPSLQGPFGEFSPDGLQCLFWECPPCRSGVRTGWVKGRFANGACEQQQYV